MTRTKCEWQDFFLDLCHVHVVHRWRNYFCSCWQGWNNRGADLVYNASVRAYPTISSWGFTSVPKKPHYCLYRISSTVLKFLFHTLQTKLVVLLACKHFTVNSVFIFPSFKEQQVLELYELQGTECVKLADKTCGLFALALQIGTQSPVRTVTAFRLSACSLVLGRDCMGWRHLWIWRISNAEVNKRHCR